jgi:hypothetical protein
MPGESHCLCCGGEMLYGNYCRRCINAMDEDASLFEEVLIDGRFRPGKEDYVFEELDFNRSHNDKMRA